MRNIINWVEKFYVGNIQNNEGPTVAGISALVVVFFNVLILIFSPVGQSARESLSISLVIAYFLNIIQWYLHLRKIDFYRKHARLSLLIMLTGSLLTVPLGVILLLIAIITGIIWAISTLIKRVLIKVFLWKLIEIFIIRNELE